MVIRRDESLPRLAWYAVIDRRTDTCEVEVGRFVEVDPSPEPRWVVSGFWDGDFAAGHFHTAEHVFGSGLRLDGDEVVVVPAHSTVDRCLYVRDGHHWHVSNSMVVLLGRLGARLDPQADHRRWSESTCNGVNNYVRQLDVVHPRFKVMHQLLFEALHLDARGDAAFRCHDVPRTFTGFDDYLAQLTRALKTLWKNATDPRRTRPMRAVATVSRGYDSPTVLALVQPIVRTPMLVWAAPGSNTRLPAALQKLMHADLPDDDGSQIAELLGAQPRPLDVDERRLPAELEAWCWAGAQSSPELLFHAALSEADTHDMPTILFSGHRGEGVWETDLPELSLTGQLTRGSPSGVSLGEARVRYGVIDCSPAFLFARSVAAIHRVTMSDELALWRLGNGYDRPICRRILEDRGVPRGTFGWRKKVVARDFESPRGEALRALFFQTRWSKLTESIYRDLTFGLSLGNRVRSFLRYRGDRAKRQRQTFLMTSAWLADRYARH